MAREAADRLASLSRPRRWAAAASLLWVVVVLGYAAGFASVGAVATRGMLFLDAMFVLAALVLPLMLVWLAAWLAEELARQREIVLALAELTSPLIDSLAATRAALEAHGPASPEAIRKAVQSAIVGARGPDLMPHLDRVVAAQARAEALLQQLGGAAPRPPAEAAPPARPAPKRPAAAKAAAPVPAREAPSPELPLLPGTPEAARPAWPTLVRALDFPRDADDEAGFRALREALRHHSLAQMLQAAEDVLNLLSQEGVFVDELPMDPVDPAAWRRFIAGKRGAEVAAVGGIRDERALEVTRGLMKGDSIFRDTALFFQRRFDSVLSEFAADADDAALAELANTRSARAFVLLARLNRSLD
jgi:hypothetical protein